VAVSNFRAATCGGSASREPGDGYTTPKIAPQFLGTPVSLRWKGFSWARFYLSLTVGFDTEAARGLL